MSEPRVCIVGAGNLSTRRIYPYIGTAGAILAGVCDLDQEKAARNARLFGGNVYNNLAAMLEAEKPDGVIICVGPAGHAKLAPQVMERGIPVYTEKPPSVRAADALEVARVSKRTGVLCTTAFKKRYNVAYSRAKEWLAQYPAEDWFSISIDYGSGQYPNKDEASSFLLDFALHIIDLAAYLMGDAQRVMAFAKGMDAYAVSIEFANGAVGSLNLNDGRAWQLPTEEVEISVRGGNAMTIHNSSCWRTMKDMAAGEWREPPTFVSGGDSGNDTGHLAEIVDFLAAIREGRETRSTIYESYKSMVLYEAIKTSAETGRIVDVTYESL